jgi:protein-disulfide isomerase
MDPSWLTLGFSGSDKSRDYSIGVPMNGFAAGNLLAPITIHAFYDFVAPVYFLRAHVRQHRAARIKD